MISKTNKHQNMSKVKRVPTKRVGEQKLYSHYSSLSLINSSQQFGKTNLATDKQELHAESPYAQKLSKIRSTSILKEPTLSQSSGLVSPPLNPKFSMNLKSKINLSSSFISKSKDPNESQVKIKKKAVVPHRQSIPGVCFSIEARLDEVHSNHMENGISNEILDKYRECMDEIIEVDKIYGGALGKIKFAYEDWIKAKTDSISENSRMKTEIVEFSRKLTEQIEENKQLHRKVQKFSRENADLGRLLDERDTHCRALQEHLLKVTDINIDEVPQDKTSWKVLIAENKNYAEICAKMKKKIKTIKLQEKKLLKLFWIFKQKGYPVEEIYESFSSKKKAKPTLIPTLEDASDNEPNISEPTNSRPKPGNIPFLKMDQVEPNSFTRRNSDSGDDELF